MTKQLPKNPETLKQESKVAREYLDETYPGGAKQALANLRKMMEGAA